MANAIDLSVEPTEDPSARAPEPSLDARLAAMKAAQRKQHAPSYELRIARLDKLEKAIRDNKEAFVKAIAADFGHRSRHETLSAEVFVTLSAISHCREHLHEWMETESRPVSWLFAPARAEVMAQPLGVVGIIAPWNYPMHLALSPLAGALAAGNRVMIKPSELSPETSRELARCLSAVFADDEVLVVTGGPEVGVAFSKLAFDHLLFTGSTRVGKVVLRAAAETLVPVPLELGGKSPAIIADDFPLDVAATRIMYGKSLNAGQTCIAPDYVLVPRRKLDAFVDECKAAFSQMYPTVKDNVDYTSVVSDRHFARLQQLVDEARITGAKIVPTSTEDTSGTRKMAPVLIVDPPDHVGAMSEEIFGPILPIKPYDTLDDAIAYVNDHDRPLALYFFGYDDDALAKVLEQTVSGGVSINDTILHVAQDDLPFGGVGGSGMGHYHGKEGFDTFSKKKPVFYQARVNGGALLRPPYGKAISMLLRFLVGR